MVEHLAIDSVVQRRSGVPPWILNGFVCSSGTYFSVESGRGVQKDAVREMRDLLLPFAVTQERINREAAVIAIENEMRSGGAASLGNIRPIDVERWHAMHYRESRCVIVEGTSQEDVAEVGSVMPPRAAEMHVSRSDEAVGVVLRWHNPGASELRLLADLLMTLWPQIATPPLPPVTTSSTCHDVLLDEESSLVQVELSGRCYVTASIAIAEVIVKSTRSDAAGAYLLRRISAGTMHPRTVASELQDLCLAALSKARDSGDLVTPNCYRRAINVQEFLRMLGDRLRVRDV